MKHFFFLINKWEKGREDLSSLISSECICLWVLKEKHSGAAIYRSPRPILTKFIRRGTCQSPYENEMHYHSSAWKTFLQWVFKDHSNSHGCLQGPETALLFPPTVYDSVCLVILYMVILFVFVLAKCLQLDQCHLLVLRDSSSSN